MSIENFDSLITHKIRPLGPWQILNFVACLFPTFLPYDILVVYIIKTPPFKFNLDCLPMNASSAISSILSNTSDWCPPLHLEELARQNCNHNAFIYNLTKPEWRGTLVEQFDIVCSRAYLRPMSITMFNIGQIISCFVSSMIADKFGRKPTLIMAAFLVLIPSTIAIFTEQMVIFLFCQLILAIGHLTMFNILIILLAELTNQNCRIIATSSIQITYGLSLGIFLPIVAYLSQSWRTMYIIFSCLSCSCVAMPFLLSESPRWLLAKNKRAEAWKELKRALNLNRKCLRGPAGDQKDAIKEMETFVNSFADTVRNEKSVNPTIKENIKKAAAEILLILRTPSIRKNLFKVVIIWSSETYAFYLALYNTANIKTSFYISTALICGSLVPSLIFRLIFLRNIQFKRLLLSLCSILLAIFLCLIGLLILLPNSTSRDVAIVGVSFISKFVCDLMLSVFYTHIPELFPTEVRAYTLGICSGFGAIASIFAAFMANMGSSIWPPLPMIVGAVLMSISVVIGCSLSDHVHRMPDTIMDIEEENSYVEYGLTMKKG